VLTYVLKFTVPGLYALEMAAIFLKIQEGSNRNSERSDRNFLHFCNRLHRQSSSSVSKFQLLSLKAVSFIMETVAGFNSLPRAKPLSREHKQDQGTKASKPCCLPITAFAKAKTPQCRDATVS
jgi:hypothetical protein